MPAQIKSALTENSIALFLVGDDRQLKLYLEGLKPTGLHEQGVVE